MCGTEVWEDKVGNTERPSICGQQTTGSNRQNEAKREHLGKAKTMKGFPRVFPQVQLQAEGPQRVCMPSELIQLLGRRIRRLVTSPPHETSSQFDDC
jgi:hypothetical protein